MKESANNFEQTITRAEQPLYKSLLLALGMASLYSYSAWDYGMAGLKMLPWYLVSATIYTVGRVADRASTLRTIDTVSHAKEMGIDLHVEEKNPNLPAQLNRNTRNAFCSHRKTIIDACHVASGLIFPPGAAIVGIASCLAAIHNEALRSKIEKEISDSNISFEERIAACPIHQWTDIDGYLERAQVPNHIRRPFHEIVLVRGEFPKNMLPEQGEEFGKRAVNITHQYEIQPGESHSLKILFGQLVEKWLTQDFHGLKPVASNGNEN